MIKKTNAKQFRYDEDVYEGTKALSKKTGLSSAEIGRRLMRFAFDYAIENKTLEFLYQDGFDEPELLKEMEEIKENKKDE